MSKEKACPLCVGSYVGLAGHLRRLHCIQNPEERAMLLKLVSGRVDVLREHCPVPNCDRPMTRLDRHLARHREVTTQQMREYMAQLQLKVTIRLLAKLRATNPLAPLRSDLDLVAPQSIPFVIKNLFLRNLLCKKNGKVADDDADPPRPEEPCASGGEGGLEDPQAPSVDPPEEPCAEAFCHWQARALAEVVSELDQTRALVGKLSASRKYQAMALKGDLYVGTLKRPRSRATTSPKGQPKRAAVEAPDPSSRTQNKRWFCQHIPSPSELRAERPYDKPGGVQRKGKAKPRRGKACPLCEGSFVKLGCHLITWHWIKNAEERAMLLRLVSGRVDVNRAHCPVPACAYLATTRLDRHLLQNHQDVSRRKMKEYMALLKLNVTIKSLAKLRATDPLVPLRSDLDLVAPQSLPFVKKNLLLRKLLGKKTKKVVDDDADPPSPEEPCASGGEGGLEDPQAHSVDPPGEPYAEAVRLSDGEGGLEDPQAPSVHPPEEPCAEAFCHWQARALAQAVSELDQTRALLGKLSASRKYQAMALKGDLYVGTLKRSAKPITEDEESQSLSTDEVQIMGAGKAKEARTRTGKALPAVTPTKELQLRLTQKNTSHLRSSKKDGTQTLSRKPLQTVTPIKQLQLRLTRINIPPPQNE